MDKITQTELRQILCYNPLSGNFMWRIKPRPGIKIGSTAGYEIRKRSNRMSYWCIRLHGRIYRAHRLAFLYIIGQWPEDQVDHKDGDGLNNRWLNLREATQSQNQVNRGPIKNNKLGIKGVRLFRNGKYHARIGYQGKSIHLGYYDTIEEASKVRQSAERKLFGEFAKQPSGQS